MKTLCLAVVIAFSTATAVALHAQTSTAPNATTVTVTGCIERSAPQTPTGTSGTVGATAPDTKFVLTTPSVGTAGTSGTTATSSNIVYRLNDTDQAKVSAHEGHKVEITGTVEKGTAAPDESKSETTSAPKLSVESVRMISSTCSR